MGFLIALWSANAGVKAMIDGLNVIEERDEGRTFRGALVLLDYPNQPFVVTQPYPRHVFITIFLYATLAQAFQMKRSLREYLLPWPRIT